MNWLNTILVLGTAFLAVFWEAAFGGVRNLLGAQVDLLPPLVVYASLYTGTTTVGLLAVAGGLWFDSLSANPSVSPCCLYFAVGSCNTPERELILRDQFSPSWCGWGASTTTPVLTILLLFSIGRTPFLGWGTFWQLFVLSKAAPPPRPLF